MGNPHGLEMKVRIRYLVDAYNYNQNAHVHAWIFLSCYETDCACFYVVCASHARYRNRSHMNTSDCDPMKKIPAFGWFS